MMGIKVVLQLLVFALVFTMLTKHQALGEQDCYAERDSVIHECMETLRHDAPYKHPTASCRRVVRRSDVACICRVLTDDDEKQISVDKFLQLARECGRPVIGVPKCGSKLFYYSSFLLTYKM